MGFIQDYGPTRLLHRAKTERKDTPIAPSDSLQQRISQRISSLQAANSTVSAQNQQISTPQQGTAQGSTGISMLTCSARDT